MMTVIYWLGSKTCNHRSCVFYINKGITPVWLQTFFSLTWRVQLACLSAHTWNKSYHYCITQKLAYFFLQLGMPSFTSALHCVWLTFQIWNEYPNDGRSNDLSGMGAYLQSLIYGYGGLRIHLEYLFMNPKLPYGVHSMILRDIGEFTYPINRHKLASRKFGAFTHAE